MEGKSELMKTCCVYSEWAKVNNVNRVKTKEWLEEERRAGRSGERS